MWTDPYAVLGIAHGSSDIEVRQAYKSTLLASHPDKQTSHTKPRYSIDDVNAAYRQIRNTETHAEPALEQTINFNEVVDLSDCVESELPDGSLQWSRACRCGETNGYLLFEHDLELNGEADEIAVQCSGCSIWILVQYSVE